MLAALACICSACVTELRPTGVRSTATGELEVLYRTCRGHDTLGLLESADGTGDAEPRGAGPTNTVPVRPRIEHIVWRGSPPPHEDTFIVPFGPRPHHRYAIRILSASNELTSVFGSSELRRHKVVFSTNGKNVVVSEAVWWKRATDYCHRNDWVVWAGVIVLAAMTGGAAAGAIAAVRKRRHPGQPPRGWSP